MVNARLEVLLEQLLNQTKEFQASVLNNENDGDAWGACLDRRQETMDAISSLLQQGAVLTEKHKSAYIAPAFAIHEQILTVMKAKMLETSTKLATARRNREIIPHYGDIDFNGYGVFFDKKK